VRAGKRRRSRSGIGTLLVLRLLLIANGLTLLAIGALYIVYGSRPGGYIVGGVLIGIAAVLFSCLPLTEPYRRRRRRS